MLELVIMNMQIGFLVLFQIFTSLCFFPEVSCKLLWSLASLQIVVMVFFIKSVEEESCSKLFGIFQKKQKMPEKSMDQGDSGIWLNF